MVRVVAWQGPVRAEVEVEVLVRLARGVGSQRVLESSF